MEAPTVDTEAHNRIAETESENAALPSKSSKARRPRNKKKGLHAQDPPPVRDRSYTKTD